MISVSFVMYICKHNKSCSVKNPGTYVANQSEYEGLPDYFSRWYVL